LAASFVTGLRVASGVLPISPDFTRPIANRDCDRILLLRRIERDERFPISRHGSSPL
jgi:hypothetical protein